MTSARTAWPLLIITGSAALLLGALGFQYWGGLAPCPLCVLQRWPHGAAIVLAGLALALAGRANPAPLLALAALAVAVSAGIAFFHVGVEQAWWPGLGSCAGGGMGGSLDEMLAGASTAAAPTCDDVPWDLFGVSLAGFNLIFSAGLALAGAWGARRLWSGA